MPDRVPPEGWGWGRDAGELCPTHHRLEFMATAAKVRAGYDGAARRHLAGCECGSCEASRRFAALGDGAAKRLTRG